ncbi:MAG TPA: hypothetical protein VHT01_02185, partial [Candidatus Udaeobacter sp.]|nr:hypothetical protein [Candidatus Udaeobacter sp.]
MNAFSIDREAFTFTNYDLNIRIEPGQQRFAARGKITLRNESAMPQKIAILQISSSLDWRSIKAAGKPLQFVAQPYTSDVDHTGAFSEAVVTLPEAVAPHGSVDLEIAYEGVIVLDATRHTRIGTPEAAANSNDWDQISPKFTAVRGAGYVTWYPIATENANLADSDSVAEVLGRWKTREATSTMRLQFAVTSDETEPPELLVNAATCPVAHEVQHQFVADCSYRSLGSTVPTFVIADYQSVNRAAIEVHFFRGHDASATNYADAAEKVVPLITEWFGTPRAKAETADLPNLDTPPFESGPLLLTPLSGANSKLAGLMAAHQLTHASFSSHRSWINEGLAHFAQALYLEHESGRKTAIDYMQSHRPSFNPADKQPATTPENGTSQSLVNTNDEGVYRSKAMFVWWMLRDMIGDPALKKALASYHSDQDKEPSYLPHLVQTQTQNDLEWFFDDWVYRDRGLPDFKVVSAFTRKLLPDGYMVTITVENTGAAGAEVPLTVKFAGGEVTQRLIVRGK